VTTRKWRVYRSFATTAKGLLFCGSLPAAGTLCIQFEVFIMTRQTLEELQHDYDGKPADLIPVLQRIQEDQGYLSADALRWVSRWLKVSQNEAYGVATFYAQFRFVPPGRHHLKVCLGTACHVQGGEQMLDVLQRRLNVRPGETTPDGEYDLQRVACLGCCALAPVVTLDERTYGQMSVLKLQRALDERNND
jgi:NADH-quinone oxidoreductase subunit E